jgi:hypothetical protein
MPKPTLPGTSPFLEAREAALRDSEVHESSHDLEAHMEALRAIDGIRGRCADMTKRGHQALCGFSKESLRNSAIYDQYKHARLSLQLARDPRQVKECQDEIAYLQRDFDPDAIDREYAPVLIAAEAMRMFVATGYLTISEETMWAWHKIVREIFTAVKPDWCIGGVRAGEKGWVTAYSTCQCVRALCDLADTLERTGELLIYMHDLSIYLETLIYRGIPKAWLEIDKTRLSHELRNELASASRKVVFNIGALIESTDDIGTIVKKFEAVAKESLKALEHNLKSVKSKLNERYEPPWVELTARKYAINAIDVGTRMTGDALQLCNRKHWMKEVGQCFKLAAYGVRESMAACQNFLSSVIDGQLAASNHADTRTWEPIELAYAASAYARLLGKDCESETGALARLKLAAKLICADLSADGTLSSRMSFHIHNHTEYSVQTDELLGAVAELIRFARFPLDQRLAQHLLHYFDRQCAYSIDRSEIKGWYREFDRHRSKASLMASVDAVESLASINWMLDAGINAMILDHFKVPRLLPSEVRLGDLFYPDYGLVQPMAERESEDSTLRRRPSVAIALQEMRKHVKQGVKSTCMSLVLHGPGGTGKTKLIESLAHTCRVPLVEVTPSDLVKGGEDNVEGRARAVFETLSMLTRVVILFDEFDPILKRRDASGERETNFYSFLTPGMLPKLKALHECAKERRVAYALITNLVGTLDAPAIRKGRFDEVIGIYPPDPLSRAGYFARVAGVLARAENRGWDQKGRFKLRQLVHVVALTHSIGMTTATSAGWFRCGDKSDLQKSAAAHIYGVYEPWHAHLEPEDECDGMRGVGRFAEREWEEWHTLREWDAQVEKFERACESMTDEKVTAQWRELLQWPTQLVTAAKLERQRKRRSSGRAPVGPVERRHKGRARIPRR